MTRALLSLTLAAGAVLGQTQNPNTNASPQSSGSTPLSSPKAANPASSAREQGEPTRTLSPTEPVITIHDLCPQPKPEKNPDSCKTVITREQFDSLVAALAATGETIRPNVRRSLAQSYVELLAYEQAAKRAGVENTSQFQEVMKWRRLLALAEIYRHDLQEEYRNPSQQDIDDAYRRDPTKFTEIKLLRILIPRSNRSARNKEEYEKQALRVAEQMRERAARGEEPIQLQKEAYATLGLTSKLPFTDMGERRKASLLPEEAEEVFSLDPGGVSKVEQEPYSFVIYRVVSKKLLPEPQVADEIAHELYKQRLENALKSVTEPVRAEFNEQYFGTAAPTVTSPVTPTLPPAAQVPQSVPHQR